MDTLLMNIDKSWLFCFKIEQPFQSPGFALVIDRRRGSLQEVQIEFDKIITLFPAKIKEVFLLYHYGEGKNPEDFRQKW